MGVSRRAKNLRNKKPRNRCLLGIWARNRLRYWRNQFLIFSFVWISGEVLATTVQGEQEDVDKAVKAAKEAYTSWHKTPGHIRARYLYRFALNISFHVHYLKFRSILLGCLSNHSIARHIQKHQRLITVLESMDNGKPFRESRDADVPTVVRHFYHHAGWAQLMDKEMPQWKSIGV